MKTAISTSPHKFKPLSLLDRFQKYGRCRKCFLPKFAHPILYWAPARPPKDKSQARFGWENEDEK